MQRYSYFINDMLPKENRHENMNVPKSNYINFGYEQLKTSLMNIEEYERKRI